ncbi:hypothetical protein RCL1_007113 [Eukaryota sp. TZLM3-RCL]
MILNFNGYKSIVFPKGGAIQNDLFVLVHDRFITLCQFSRRSRYFTWKLPDVFLGHIHLVEISPSFSHLIIVTSNIDLFVLKLNPSSFQLIPHLYWKPELSSHFPLSIGSLKVCPLGNNFALLLSSSTHDLVLELFSFSCHLQTIKLNFEGSFVFSFPNFFSPPKLPFLDKKIPPGPTPEVFSFTSPKYPMLNFSFNFLPNLQVKKTTPNSNFESEISDLDLDSGSSLYFSEAESIAELEMIGLEKSSDFTFISQVHFFYSKDYSFIVFNHLSCTYLYKIQNSSSKLEKLVEIFSPNFEFSYISGSFFTSSSSSLFFSIILDKLYCYSVDQSNLIDHPYDDVIAQNYVICPFYSFNGFLLINFNSSETALVNFNQKILVSTQYFISNICPDYLKNSVQLFSNFLVSYNNCESIIFDCAYVSNLPFLIHSTFMISTPDSPIYMIDWQLNTVYSINLPSKFDFQLLSTNDLCSSSFFYSKSAKELYYFPLKSRRLTSIDLDNRLFSTISTSFSFDNYLFLSGQSFLNKNQQLLSMGQYINNSYEVLLKISLFSCPIKLVHGFSCHDYIFVSALHVNNSLIICKIAPSSRPEVMAHLSVTFPGNFQLSNDVTFQSFLIDSELILLFLDPIFGLYILIVDSSLTDYRFVKLILSTSSHVTKFITNTNQSINRNLICLYSYFSSVLMFIDPKSLITTSNELYLTPDLIVHDVCPRNTTLLGMNSSNLVFISDFNNKVNVQVSSKSCMEVLVLLKDFSSLNVMSDLIQSVSSFWLDYSHGLVKFPKISDFNVSELIQATFPTYLSFISLYVLRILFVDSSSSVFVKFVDLFDWSSVVKQGLIDFETFPHEAIDFRNFLLSILFNSIPALLFKNEVSDTNIQELIATVLSTGILSLNQGCFEAIIGVLSFISRLEFSDEIFKFVSNFVFNYSLEPNFNSVFLNPLFVSLFDFGFLPCVELDMEKVHLLINQAQDKSQVLDNFQRLSVLAKVKQNYSKWEEIYTKIVHLIQIKH